MCRVEDRPTHRLHLVHSTTYLTPTPRYHLSLTRLLLIPLKPPKLAQLDVVLVQAILGHLHALLFQFLLLLPHLVLSRSDTLPWEEITRHQGTLDVLNS